MVAAHASLPGLVINIEVVTSPALNRPTFMRIALIGYGKMGRSIEQLALAAGHGISHRIHSGNAGQVAALEHCDVAIEFTQPDAALRNFESILSQGIPLVTGTTGWHESMDQVSGLVERYEGSFFHASNFSIGVHLCLAANEYLASIMSKHKQYKCLLEEWHHTAKKDAPSGTAITFAERLIKTHAEYNRWELQTPCEIELQAPTLAVKAYREGGIPGTHRITYTSEIDQISLEHKAHSREGFARGALAAAEWLVDKESGIYTMQDLLKP